MGRWRRRCSKAAQSEVSIKIQFLGLSGQPEMKVEDRTSKIGVNGKDGEIEIAVKSTALGFCFSFDVGCSTFIF